MRVQTRSTDPAQYDVCSATRKIGLPYSDFLLFRTMCMFPDVSLVQQLSFMMYIYHLTNVWKAELRLTPNTPVMQYMNAAGGVTAITEMALSLTDGQWFDIELAIDVANHKYISGRFDGVEKSLADIGFYDADDDTASCVHLFMEIGSAGAAQATAYVDQIYCGEFPNL